MKLESADSLLPMITNQTFDVPRSNRKGSASSSAVKRKNSRAASSSDSRRGSVNNVNGLDSRSDDSGSINTIDQVDKFSLLVTHSVL